MFRQLVPNCSHITIGPPLFTLVALSLFGYNAQAQSYPVRNVICIATQGTVDDIKMKTGVTVESAEARKALYRAWHAYITPLGYKDMNCTDFADPDNQLQMRSVDWAPSKAPPGKASVVVANVRRAPLTQAPNVRYPDCGGGTCKVDAVSAINSYSAGNIECTITGRLNPRSDTPISYMGIRMDRYRFELSDHLARATFPAHKTFLNNALQAEAAIQSACARSAASVPGRVKGKVGPVVYVR